MTSDLKLELAQILKNANKEAQMKPSHIKVAIKEYVPHLHSGSEYWAWYLNNGLVCLEFLLKVSTNFSTIFVSR